MTVFDEFVAQARFEEWGARIAEQGGEAIRLFHGRGQCYPGFEYFTVDYFSPVLWVVLYRQPEAAFWEAFTEALRCSLGDTVATAAIQHRYDRERPLDVLWGTLPESLAAREDGLGFGIQLGGRQNIGYFMDMLPARQWLKDKSKGKRVLNLFSYTCAFSVAALQAGAQGVVNIDMSKSALRSGRDNHHRNGLPQGNAEVQYLGYDIFRSWGKIKKLGPYDIVICDPPSRQAGSFEVRKDYPRILRRMPELLVEGGELLACLNAPYLDETYLRELVAEACPDAELVERLPGRPDFPEQDPNAALKVLHYHLPNGGR